MISRLLRREAHVQELAVIRPLGPTVEEKRAHLKFLMSDPTKVLSMLVALSTQNFPRI